MALSANAQRKYEMATDPANVKQLPVKGSAHLYKNAAIGMSSGYARALVAGDQFQGFADAEVDNSNGSDGALDVRVIREGYAVLAVTGVSANTDIGKAVYASDDGTFTLTAGSNSPIGKVDSWITSTTCIVKFAAGHAIAPLTDNTGSTPDNTLEDCNNSVGTLAIATSGGNTYSDAAVNTAVNTVLTAVNARLVSISNNIADLNAQLNLLAAQLGM